MTLNLHITEYRIESVSRFTDSLDTTLAERIEALLVGVRYEAAEVAGLDAGEPTLNELIAYLLTRL